MSAVDKRNNELTHMNNKMKRYIVSIHEKPPKGGFLRYGRIMANGKKNLREKVAKWNAKSKGEYIPLGSAFTTRTDK